MTGPSDSPLYEVEVTPGVERALRKLDKQVANRIVAALALLQRDPRPVGISALVGHPGVLRHRVGDYRIESQRLVILVLDVVHRHGDVQPVNR